jgi:UDP-glucose 4-epimerase
MPFSPKQQYCGQTVLLTGGLGYLGSIVLEQLLRLTEVRAPSLSGTCVRSAVDSIVAQLPCISFSVCTFTIL